LLLLSDLTSQAEKILEEAKTYATSNSSTPILYPICKSLVEQGFLIRFSNLVVTQLISFERESPSPAGTNLLRRAHDFVTGASNELKSATNVLTERKPQSLQASLTKAIDATRSKLIEKYVQQTFSNLNQKAGFPMVKDGTNVMTANEVVQFARDVNALQAASTSEVVQSYPHTGQLAALRSALSNLVPVVLACVTNDSLQTFLLSINDTKEQCYLYLEVESQSVTNCGNISDKKLSLAPCGVDSKLVFNSRLTKDRPIAYTNRIGGSWGAFRLLTGENYKATRVTNGPTWKVVVQNGPDATNLIAVELVFQSPLPELKDWPRMTNLQAILPQSH
jgi:hypothetical protein